VKTELSENDDR